MEKRLTFTLEDIIEIIGGIEKKDIPNIWRKKLQITLDKICYDKLRGDGKNSIVFDVWPKSTNRLRFEKYINNGVIIISNRVYYSANNPLPSIWVPDAQEAYYKIGKYIKKTFPMPTIGITGSVGKTTTLMLCELVFAEKFKTYVGGPGGKNYNIPVEMVYQMINRYSPEYEIHIQECGGGRSNLVREAAELLQVDAFGITKISKTHHIDKYKDVEDLIADKTSFDRVKKDNAFGVINIDDGVLNSYSFESKIYTYGINNLDADYVGKNIVQKGERLEFDIECRNELAKNTVKRFSLDIIGTHNVYNALMVYVLAKQYGISDEQIQSGFSKYKSGKIRQNVRTVAGRILYIDCFNVCSDSIKSSIEALKNININGNDSKKIAILGGENALGDKTHEINYKTGTEISDEGIDRFIFFGPKETHDQDILNYYGNGKALYEGAKSVLPDGKISYIDDLKELAKILIEETKRGDVILFKGIFRLPMFAAIDMAFGTNYTIYDVNFIGKSIKNHNYFGSYYKEIEGVNLIKPLEKELYLPGFINGKPVVRIGKSVFQGRKKIEYVTIGENCKTIGEKCFLGCENIRKINIPHTLVNIEENAFEGCRNIKEIDLRSILHISKEAFKNCIKLERVYLDDKCGTIEENAFEGCSNLTIYAPKNSYAHEYARRNDIGFVVKEY